MNWNNFGVKLAIIGVIAVFAWALTAEPPEKVYFRGGDGNCYVVETTGGIWTGFSNTGTVTTAVEPSGKQTRIVECTPEVLEAIQLREADKQMVPKIP